MDEKEKRKITFRLHRLENVRRMSLTVRVKDLRTPFLKI